MSDFTSYSGMDLPGGDYRRIRETNYLECFVACVGYNACRAFAYVSKKKECWLKNALGRQRTAKGATLGSNDSRFARELDSALLSRPACRAMS
ncbi:PAN domain-containing protein [Rhizobium sp. BR 250]